MSYPGGRGRDIASAYGIGKSFAPTEQMASVRSSLRRTGAPSR